jgi:hypothetical protein
MKKLYMKDNGKKELILEKEKVSKSGKTALFMKAGG